MVLVLGEGCVQGGDEGVQPEGVSFKGRLAGWVIDRGPGGVGGGSQPAIIPAGRVSISIFLGPICLAPQVNPCLMEGFSNVRKLQGYI